MTVTSELSRWEFAGNGVTVAFSIGKLFDDDDIVVYLVEDATGDPDLQVKTTEYTVSGILTNTVTVTFVTAPASGYTVLVYRNLALTQTVDIKNQGSFNPEIHENKFDYLLMQIQKMQEQLDRSVKLAVTDVTGADTTLPAFEPGKLLAADTAGDGFEWRAEGDPGTIPNASTTEHGLVELATNTEAQTGTDTERVITPASLQAVTGTTTRAGVLELATDGEAQTGTDTARAITAANLQAVTATETRKGVAELATAAEVTTGTDPDRIISVLRMASYAFHNLVIQPFTASGTYTPTSGMKYCIVISTGGGGGGGGADTDGNSGIVGVGGGGGAGGTAIEYFTAAQIGSSQTVTIGAAGTAGSATNGASGGNGGDTTFGALHTGGGGIGGVGSGASTGSAPEVSGSAGGTATGGTVNILGGYGDGATGFSVDGTTDIVTGKSGCGGSSFWGGGGAAVASSQTSLTTDTDVAGVDGQAYGSGGSGAISLTSTTGAAGGAGKIGICVVIEFI